MDWSYEAVRLFCLLFPCHVHIAAAVPGRELNFLSDGYALCRLGEPAAEYIPYLCCERDMEALFIAMGDWGGLIDSGELNLWS
jgi:hypothetical protein